MQSTMLYPIVPCEAQHLSHHVGTGQAGGPEPSPLRYEQAPGPARGLSWAISFSNSLYNNGFLSQYKGHIKEI